MEGAGRAGRSSRRPGYVDRCRRTRMRGGTPTTGTFGGFRPLTSVATLETHVHADHVTGAWWLKREFGCEIAVSAASGAEGADRLLRHDDRVSFGSRHLQVRATPGHTRGCLTYVLDDASLALT